MTGGGSVSGSEFDLGYVDWRLLWLLLTDTNNRCLWSVRCWSVLTELSDIVVSSKTSVSKRSLEKFGCSKLVSNLR